jgi:L-fuculose-phosphate aldolase
MIDEKLCKEISYVGRKVVSSGLTSSRFGNISVLQRDRIIITKTGSMLDELDQAQLVEVDLMGPCQEDAAASSETCVHRAIYQTTAAQAVIHTHSPYAVALSLMEETQVDPIDSEGVHFLGRMPIVEASFGSNELATKASEALRSHKACIAKGHGVFAQGRSIAEAYTMVCMAEHSSHVRYLVTAYQNRLCPSESIMKSDK